MRNMSSLRHLYINGCTNLRDMPADMGRMRSLQTLTTYIVGNDAARGIGELNDLNLGGLLELYNLRNVRNVAEARHANMHSKKSLRSLILCWDMTQWDPHAESAHHCCEEDVLPAENAEEVLEALKPHGGLKLLTVLRYPGGSFPAWMMAPPLLQNLVQINLEGCGDCQRLPPLRQLPLLKFLYVIRMYSVKHICSSTIYDNASNGRVQPFPSLKRLVLHTMQSLEKWSEYEGTATLVFPHLDELQIINCPNLMTMPELPSLESLETEGTDMQLGWVCSLTRLSSLSIGVYKTSNGTESPPLAQKKMSFSYFRSSENLTIKVSKDLAPLLEEKTRGLRTSLHYLEIESCNWFFSPSQQSSSPFSFWKNLTSLQSLSLCDCDDLVYWPEVEFRSLNSLEQIDIRRCNKLVGPSSSSSGYGEILPNLEELDISECDSLLELPKLPASLRSLYVDDCHKLNSLTEGLRHATGLENVDISNCPSLTSLPVDLGHLTALTSMEIGKLPGLKSLPEGLGQLAALTSMSISELPALKSLPEGLGHLAALESLHISSCSKLSYLPEGLQGLTALQGLSISQCPRLSSLPEGLQQRLPSLDYLCIEGCPNLEKQCKRGGPYWHLVSRIPDAEISYERRSCFSTHLPSFSCFRRPSTV